MPTLKQCELDPVRGYLSSVYATKLEYDRLSRRIMVLEALCERVTAQLTGIPGGRSEGPERLLVILADERYREAEKLKALFEHLHEVEYFIDFLDDELSKAVLKLRYLELLRWPVIRERLESLNHCYSDRQVTRLHGNAMREARKLWNQMFKEDTL